MSFEVRSGPRGLSALWNGLQLASAYDPQREAARWAETLNLDAGTLVFVAGDPWGLAAQALTARGAKAVALLPGSAAKPHLPDAIKAWAPEDSDLASFVGDVLDQWGPDAVSWQAWPAFERHAPELALEWARRFRDVYRTVQGSRLTQTRFGRRFWANAVRNIVDWETAAAVVPGSRPIVIAASGPSLNDCLDTLAAHRGQFELWALPSSFEVLVKRGMIPDAGVAVDGGYYAREHLRCLVGTDVPVLASLASAPDPTLLGRPCQFFSQGLTVERLLLGALVPGFGEVPSQGTVAVTAIELALAATSGSVFIAGLDLSFHDLRAHASPHTTDRRMLASHSRLTPYEGRLAEGLFLQAPVTIDGVRTAPALLTYAGWLRSHSRFARVYRVAPSPLRWDCMTEVTTAQASALWKTAGGTALRWEAPKSWPTRGQRRRAAETALESLLKRIEAARDDDAWIVEAARTGAPYALAEDFQDKRMDRPHAGRARRELAAFVSELRDR